ncbi:MAG: hypothetical protein A2066_00275 [Bacteroidetes bacterium GWB2_41_8]|nr:MAG: hypothetical protein A2066_00275 [Bacteroidetes bacterium GWB2_41_8]
MAFLAVDSLGQELIYEFAEDRAQCPGNCKVKYNIVKLREGDIERLTGRKLKPGSLPVKLEEK